MKRTTIPPKKGLDEMISNLVTLEMESQIHSRLQRTIKRVSDQRGKTVAILNLLPAPITEDEDVVEAEAIEDESETKLSFRR